MASLLDWFGQRIKDTENGIGSFVNGAAHTVGDAVNNVSHAVAPQPQRPQIRPPQVGVQAVQRPQSPQFRPAVPNVANFSQNSVIKRTQPGFDPLKGISDFANGVGSFAHDAVNNVVNGTASTLNDGAKNLQKNAAPLFPTQPQKPQVPAMGLNPVHPPHTPPQPSLIDQLVNLSKPVGQGGINILANAGQMIEGMPAAIANDFANTYKQGAIGIANNTGVVPAAVQNQNNFLDQMVKTGALSAADANARKAANLKLATQNQQAVHAAEQQQGVKQNQSEGALSLLNAASDLAGGVQAAQQLAKVAAPAVIKGGAAVANGARHLDQAVASVGVPHNTPINTEAGFAKVPGKPLEGQTSMFDTPQVGKTALPNVKKENMTLYRGTNDVNAKQASPDRPIYNADTADYAGSYGKVSSKQVEGNVLTDSNNHAYDSINKALRKATAKYLPPEEWNKLSGNQQIELQGWLNHTLTGERLSKQFQRPMPEVIKNAFDDLGITHIRIPGDRFPGTVGKIGHQTEIIEIPKPAPQVDKIEPTGQQLPTDTGKRSQNQSALSVASNTEQQLPSSTQPISNELAGSQIAETPKMSQSMTGEMTPRTPHQTDGSLQNNPAISSKERGFVETIINDPKTDSHIKDSLTSLYTVRNTKELQTRAANLVKDSPDLARRVAESGHGDISVAAGSELLKHLQSKGEYETAIGLADNLAKQLTEAGRTAQAASIYGRLTPEGVLRFAQKELNKYNEINKLVGGKKLSLSAEQAANLSKKAETLNNMAEGRAKDIASQELVQEIHKLLPSSLPAKISTLQTMAQLLNPKTSTRNILGNALFGATDNVAQVGAAGIDKVISKVRGTDRTVPFPNLKTQYEGIKTGGKQAYEETLKGVNLGPNTQFELGDVPTFRRGVLGNLEKTMGVTLKVPDRAAYQAAFDDTVKGLMKANKLEKPTPEILELANANGLYRTFQDKSKAAQLFSKLKESLNSLGFEGRDGKKFGLGDLILKYPKTPGNILARGLDYSPVGILKGLFEIAKPAIKKQPFDQAAFANAISRGTLGTAAIGGAGAVLGSLGIITEAPNKDTDARNLQKSSGQGGYQINIDALRRFVLSGFNKDEAKIKDGDTLVSYDWAQPLSIPLSAGAALGKGQNAIDGATSTIENVSQGLNTLIEQPLVTGVNTFANNIKNKGLVGAGLETLKGAPASFVPTASNQARQLTDNKTRSTYDPNGWVESVNKFTNRIPGLSYLLHPQVDSLGNDKSNFQNDSNNIFNVMFNPAFVNKYQPQDAAKLPLGILSDTGETKQIPTTTKTSQKVNGSSTDLTPQQNEDFQRFVGLKTKDYLTQASNDPKFMKLTPQDQASRISDAISSIQSAAKINILGDKPKKVDNSVKNVINTGGAKLVTKPVDTNGGSAVEINSNISADYSKVLDDYNNMTSDEQKKLFNDTPDAEYKYKLAKFENDKANGTLSEAQKLTTNKALRTDKIGAGYSKNVRDLYGVSKADLADYLATEEKGVDKKKIAEDLYAYDRALFDSGASSTLKYKYGIAGKGKSKGGGKKGNGVAAGKNLVNLTKYANGIRPPKTTGSKAPSLGMKQPQLKKTVNRKFTARTASVKGTKTRKSNTVVA